MYHSNLLTFPITHHNLPSSSKHAVFVRVVRFRRRDDMKKIPTEDPLLSLRPSSKLEYFVSLSIFSIYPTIYIYISLLSLSLTHSLSLSLSL
ncbi:hypothetical protein OAV88_02240 [bacterium]|nr:hypothetical protein [bacterium]